MWRLWWAILSAKLSGCGRKRWTPMTDTESRKAVVDVEALVVEGNEHLDDRGLFPLSSSRLLIQRMIYALEAQQAVVEAAQEYLKLPVSALIPPWSHEVRHLRLVLRKALAALDAPKEGAKP